MEKDSNNNNQKKLEEAISRYFEVVQNHASIPAKEGEEFDKKRSLEVIDKHIHSARKVRKFTILKIAASLFLLLSVGYIGYTYKHSIFANDIEFIAESGVKKIVLPDSSTVRLNKGAKLSYSNVFNQTERKVNLTGEAYFEVHRDVSKPFIIQSGRIETKVLGTSFNIDASHEKENISVTVLTGKVAVKDVMKDKEVYLLPNEQAFFDVEAGDIAVSSVDAKTSVIWAEVDDLLYKDAKLSKVILDIERKYKVNINLSPQMRECSISVDLNNLSLDKVMKVICGITGADAHYTDSKNIKLVGKGCAN